MQSTPTNTNPFLKKTNVESAIPTRWAKLDVDEEKETKKNNFLRSEVEDSVFDNTSKTSGFRTSHPSRNFMRYTVTKAETPPKPFNLNERREEFPALGTY